MEHGEVAVPVCMRAQLALIGLRPVARQSNLQPFHSTLVANHLKSPSGFLMTWLAASASIAKAARTA
jgi:hypothetical protein